MLKILLVMLLSFEGVAGFMPVATIQTQVESERYYSANMYLGDSGEGTTYSVYIEFDSYTVTDTHLEKTFPNYENYSQENSCAPMAGALCVTYYDASLTNLIPNYEPGSYYNGQYYFRAQNSTFYALKESLYTIMGTNTENPGTSVSQFKSGLKTYVENQDYSIAYNNCGSTFNLNTAVNYFSLQRPIVLFLGSYIYHPATSVTLTDTYLSMNARAKNVGHVVVAYGYREYHFYKDGEMFRTEKFLVTVFGDGTQGFLSVNDVSGIDEAYAINIY